MFLITTELGIRYVHGKSDVRPAEVVVNNEVVNASLPFSTTGEWTAWTTITIPVELKEGKNTIRLNAQGNKGLVNTDHFVLTPDFLIGLKGKAVSNGYT